MAEARKGAIPRVEVAAKQVELEFGAGLRLRFEEGCDPAYVAAVVSRLR